MAGKQKEQVERVNIDSLFKIENGAFKRELQVEIENAERDIDLRPVPGKREVVLKIIFDPAFKDGDPTGYTDIDIELTHKYPKKGGYAATARKSPSKRCLVFNPQSRDNPNQLDMFDQEEAEQTADEKA